MLVINPLGHFCQVQQNARKRIKILTGRLVATRITSKNCPTIMKYLTSLIAQMFPVQIVVNSKLLGKEILRRSGCFCLSVCSDSGISVQNCFVAHFSLAVAVDFLCLCVLFICSSLCFSCISLKGSIVWFKA